MPAEKIISFSFIFIAQANNCYAGQMLSICRTIEIDLLQIIGEPDIPKPIQPVKNVLM